MPPLPEIVYPILQTTMRLLIRRAEQRELWFQKRMRRADVSALADYSFRQAVAYANRMAEVSPAYRRKLNEAGVKLPITESREAWLSLPTLRKSDFQQDSDEWFNNTLRRDELQWSCTSGSTGEPYRFPVDAKTLRGEHISFELSLRALGWRPGFREGALKMEMPPAKGLTRLARRLTGTVPIGFSAVEFRKEHAAEVMSAFRDGNVKYLRGYSSALALLAQEAQQKGLSCQIPLVTTFGEGLSTAQQEVIEKVFHCQAYRDYGGSEAMHVGFECPARTGYHLDLSRFHVEVLDGERTVQPGETGEIVVTCFRNGAMPFVRYRMGDLGTVTDPNEPCPCENTQPRLSAVEGRINDTILTPTGRFVNVLFFVYVLEFAHEHITGFRVIQRDTDWLEILYVPRHDRALEHLKKIEPQIAERTDGSMKITWKEVGEIPPSPSGKRRILVPLEVWKAQQAGKS